MNRDVVSKNQLNGKVSSLQLLFWADCGFDCLCSVVEVKLQFAKFA